MQAHGVSFELAKTVFKDPFAIERLDDREDYGEERFVIIGMAEGHVLRFAAYTEREGRLRQLPLMTHSRKPDLLSKSATTRCRERIERAIWAPI